MPGEQAARHVKANSVYRRKPAAGWMDYEKSVGLEVQAALAMELPTNLNGIKTAAVTSFCRLAHLEVFHEYAGASFDPWWRDIG